MSIQTVIEALRELLILAPAILIAITVHEYIQGYVAWKLGDTTPVDTGMLKFNPRFFIDGLGFIYFIAFGYGWSKSIPIDARNFKKPLLWSFYVGIAGIGANLLVAALFMLLIILYKPAPEGYIYNLFMHIIRINLNYFLISFFPILPLTGGRVLSVLWEYYAKTEFIGIIFLFIFFIFGGTKLLDSIVINFINLIQ